MLYAQEKAIIVSTCKLMQEMGYFLGTWGNISLRVGDHILMTPSRVAYDAMKPEDIVVITLDAQIVEGTKNPTSEKEVHRQIYLIRDDVRAIIHAHTPHAMAVSALPIANVPCTVEEMSQLLGGSIPLAKNYVPAAQHEQLGLAAAEAIGDRNGVILRNHGPVSCGRTLEEAILCSQVIEKACGIYLSIGEKAAVIANEYVQSERYRFLYTYGKEKT